jgi:hypothetical protein
MQGDLDDAAAPADRAGGADQTPAAASAALAVHPASGAGTGEQALASQSAPQTPPPGPVTARARMLLAGLDEAPVDEHAQLFSDVHALLQDALGGASSPA